MADILPANEMALTDAVQAQLTERDTAGFEMGLVANRIVRNAAFGQMARPSADKTIRKACEHLGIVATREGIRTFLGLNDMFVVEHSNEHDPSFLDYLFHDEAEAVRFYAERIKVDVERFQLVDDRNFRKHVYRAGGCEIRIRRLTPR